MSHQSGAGGSEDKDRAAIAQTLDRFRDAWNTHDAHAFALTFTDDADFTNVAGAHAQGRANVEAFHAPVFAGIFKDSHQTAKIRSIRFLKPDLAAVDVDWEMTGAKSPDGRAAALSQGTSELGDGQASRWLVADTRHAQLRLDRLPGPREVSNQNS